MVPGGSVDGVAELGRGDGLGVPGLGLGLGLGLVGVGVGVGVGLTRGVLSGLRVGAGAGT